MPTLRLPNSAMLCGQNPLKDGSWWHCTVAFDIDTLEQARMTVNTADDSDPANGLWRLCPDSNDTSECNRVNRYMG